MSSQPDKSAPIMSPDAVLATAEEYSRTIREVLGGERVSYAPTRNTTPCTGANGEDAGEDGPRWLYYADNVILPGDRHQAAVERLSRVFTERGMVVQEDTKFTSGGVRLRVENPQDGFGMQVQSTSPPTEITLRVSSPCYLPT